MWKRDEAVRPASGQPRLRRSRPRQLTAGAPGPRPRGEPSHGEGHREHRQVGRHQRRAERQRRSDHRRSRRRHDPAARPRADDRPERPIKAQVFAKSVIVLGEVTGQRHGQRQGRHPRQRLGRRRHHLAARRDRRRRALPRQRRHAAQGRRGAAAGAAKPARRRPRPPQPQAQPPARRSASAPSSQDSESGSGIEPAIRSAVAELPTLDPLTSACRGPARSPRAAQERARRPSARPRRPADDPVFATKALRKFLTCLTSRESPVLLDLGPVVGSNVSFFGEQLGCKIFVEDIFADLDRHVRDGKLDALPAFLKTRFPQADGDRSTASCAGTSSTISIAARRRRWPTQLTRVLRPDGALLGFFGTAPAARRALHEIHHRRRSEPEAPAVSGGARPPGDSAQPRHHPAVRRPARLRLVPAAEQPARDPVPQARR